MGSTTSSSRSTATTAKPSSNLLNDAMVVRQLCQPSDVAKGTKFSADTNHSGIEALPLHRATRPGAMCFGLPTLLTSSDCSSQRKIDDAGSRPGPSSSHDHRPATLLTSSHCTSHKEYNDAGSKPTLFSPHDERLAWVNIRSFRLGSHVCVGGRSGAICLGPVSGGRFMVKFDDDGSTSGYLQYTKLVRVPFIEGDSVHIQGRRGVIVCGFSSDGMFKMRFDDDGTTSSSLKEDEMQWAPLSLTRVHHGGRYGMIVFGPSADGKYKMKFDDDGSISDYLEEGQMLWVPLKLRCGNHVRDRASARSGVIRSGPSSDGKFEVKFDGDGTISESLRLDQIIKVPFTKGDQVMYGANAQESPWAAPNVNQSGVISHGPTPAGKFLMIFDEDDSVSSLLDEDEIAWAPVRLALGSHVRSRLDGRSGVIRSACPDSGGRYKVRFDEDRTSSEFLTQKQFVKLPFTKGDRVRHGDRCGEIIYGPDIHDVFRIRFDDDSCSGLLKEDEMAWAPCYSKHILPPCWTPHGSESKILYHLTSEGEAIQKSGEMLRGLKGAVGGGIYFSATKKECVRKAKSRGWIVKARVLTGRAKVINYIKGMDLPDLTFRQLQKAKYDSVELRGFSSGPEYIVYSKEQVEILAVCPERSVR